MTHGDADHINGIQELLQNQKQGVKIDAFVLPPEEYMDEKLLHLAEIAKENGARVLTIYAGEKVGTYLKCIAPLTTRKNERIRGKEEEMPRLEAGNEASVVLELKDGAFQMLLTGDLEGRGEEQLVESGALESCPILKAAGIGPTGYYEDEGGRHSQCGKHAARHGWGSVRRDIPRCGSLAHGCCLRSVCSHSYR